MDRAKRTGRNSRIGDRSRYRVRIGEPDRGEFAFAAEPHGIDCKPGTVEQDEAFAGGVIERQVLGSSAAAQQDREFDDAPAERFGAGELHDFPADQGTIVPKGQQLGGRRGESEIGIEQLHPHTRCPVEQYGGSGGQGIERRSRDRAASPACSERTQCAAGFDREECGSRPQGMVGRERRMNARGRTIAVTVPRKLERRHPGRWHRVVGQRRTLAGAGGDRRDITGHHAHQLEFDTLGAPFPARDPPQAGLVGQRHDAPGSEARIERRVAP